MIKKILLMTFIFLLLNLNTKVDAQIKYISNNLDLSESIIFENNNNEDTLHQIMSYYMRENNKKDDTTYVFNENIIKEKESNNIVKIFGLILLIIMIGVYLIFIYLQKIREKIYLG